MTRGFLPLSCFVLVVVSLGAQICAGQAGAKSAETASAGVDTSHCRTIMAGDPRGAPLDALCEFALVYRSQLPDFVCGQTTTSNDQRSKTVLEAQVRFERGYERYSNVTINGKPPDATSREVRVLKFMSSGELGSNLVDLFTPPIVAEFHFRKEEELRHTHSFEYEFRVAKEKNTFWSIRDSRGTIVNPEYKGEIWLESTNGRILRIKLHPVHLPSDFGLESVDMTIDYGEISIADAGMFLLPNSSETTVCKRGFRRVFCTRHILAFHDCRKFGAKSRIVTDTPEP